MSAAGAPAPGSGDDPSGGGRDWHPPGAGHPERGALPLHLRPVAAALFDDLPAPPAKAAVEAAVGSVAAGRDRIAAERPGMGEVVVDAYRVRLAAACPASAATGDDGFAWTPATAARNLGLRAVALHHCGDARPRGRPAGGAIERAVEVVMAEHASDGGERTPGPWLATLDDAGRAVARAQAQRWAEQAVAWLPLRLVDRGALRFLDDDWWPGGARNSRTLVVHGRRDLTVNVGGRRVAVTVASGAAQPQAGAVDALTALAATLCDRRSRLVRVVRVHPASGEVVATDVTPAVLDRGVEVVLSTAAAMAAAVAGAAVVTVPGAGCAWCRRLERCPPGLAWRTRPDRRSMGLPLPQTRLDGAPEPGPSPG